jgi:hypothetical protein
MIRSFRLVNTIIRRSVRVHISDPLQNDGHVSPGGEKG